LNATTSTPPAPQIATSERAGYLRQPTLRGDRIVFVADDDLWSVAASGGVARRLTAGLAEASTPALSPDGRWLAFVGRDEQHPEVYAMAADGGQAKRMTWLGTDVQVRGWTPAGDIVYVTTQGQPFFRNHQAFAVAPTGGASRALELGQVNHIAWGAGGRVAIGRNTEDPARWKRYRGGRAGAIWVDAEGSGTFRRLVELAGNVTSPMWIGERLYFIGDGEGVGNLYSCRPDGSDVRRHTDHDDHYARQAQSDGVRIVYMCGARLWLFDPASDSTRELAIETPAHRTQSARRFVTAADHLESFRLHPQGHSLAIVARGQLFAMPLWEGAATRRIDDSGEALASAAAASAAEDGPAVRLRRGQWLADGATLVAASDASGEEKLVVFAGDGSARTLPWDCGHVTALAAAPVGSAVALANHRNEVWIGDVASGDLTAVDSSGYGRSDDLAWSPDGAWLAYTFAADTRHVALKLFSRATRSSTWLTEPEFRDTMPAFDPDGRYLYFVSVRTFDPVYDSVRFDLSFPRGARPYLIALQAGGRPPFDPEPRGLAPELPNGAGGVLAGGEASGAKKQERPAAPVRIDLDGIAQRVAAFPVAEGRYGRIAGIAGGKVVWNTQNLIGAHGRGGHKEAAGKLERFDFATGRAETVAEKSDDFALSADTKTLVYRDGKQLRAVFAAGKAEKPDPADAEGPPSRKNGRIDLDRIRVAIEPRREWRQMLREVWRLQRDQFWSDALSGVDWNAVWQLYAPLVERVATRADVSDLIWEMQGELGTSHAYEIGGDHRKAAVGALGHLACTSRWDAARGGWEITRIARGDAWDAAADSPLNAVGVEAKVGERIVAIDGQRLTESLPPEALLVHRAGQKVQLSLSGEGGGERRRDVVVTALADDVPIYYREWVEKNRAWVHERSQGRVGYFHVPDMQAAGFAEFHRYFATECERDALIVDVRYNRGGHVSQLLIEKVARRRLAFVHSRWMNITTYPEEVVAGPVVTLTNEHAGSDGDIFSHTVKLMKIGPLVGTRTWGGVVGIWPRHRLVDGSETTQPEFAFWFTDVGFGVENHGTDPDVEVDNAPQDAAAGHDRQLETALQVALDAVARTAPVRAPEVKRPMLARKPLPPRR